MGNNESFYTQSGGNENRTYIPGMKRKPAAGGEAGAANTMPEAPSVRIELQGRPVAGVLYSVSKDNCGEIFPVYIGRNSIGNKPESDVYLSEESVDTDHALLLIRKLNLQDGSKRVTMSISDSGSQTGTYLNDQPLDDDVVPIKGGDIIGIGNAYKFLFVPLDAESAGLEPSANFKATKRVENRPTVNNDYLIYMGMDEGVYPTAVGEEDEFTFYGRTAKKKEDHSSKKTL